MLILHLASNLFLPAGQVLSSSREQLLSSLGALKLLVGLKTAAQLHPLLGGGKQTTQCLLIRRPSAMLMLTCH